MSVMTAANGAQQLVQRILAVGRRETSSPSSSEARG